MSSLFLFGSNTFDKILKTFIKNITIKILSAWFPVNGVKWPGVRGSEPSEQPQVSSAPSASADPKPWRAGSWPVSREELQERGESPPGPERQRRWPSVSRVCTGGTWTLACSCTDWRPTPWSRTVWSPSARAAETWRLASPRRPAHQLWRWRGYDVPSAAWASEADAGGRPPGRGWQAGWCRLNRCLTGAWSGRWNSCGAEARPGEDCERGRRRWGSSPESEPWPADWI